SSYYTVNNWVSQPSLLQCQAFCGSGRYDHYVGAPSNQCYCKTLHEQNTASVSCPRRSCTMANNCDALNLYWACDDPGSCAKYQNPQYVSCTTQTPGNPPGNCTNPALTYTLTVSKSGVGAGTVVSNAGQISCGGICNALYSNGDVVT